MTTGELRDMEEVNSLDFRTGWLWGMKAQDSGLNAWLNGGSNICIPGREHRRRGRFIVGDGGLDLK